MTGFSSLSCAATPLFLPIITAAPPVARPFRFLRLQPHCCTNSSLIRDVRASALALENSSRMFCTDRNAISMEDVTGLTNWMNVSI